MLPSDHALSVSPSAEPRRTAQRWFCREPSPHCVLRGPPRPVVRSRERARRHVVASHGREQWPWQAPSSLENSARCVPFCGSLCPHRGAQRAPPLPVDRAMAGCSPKGRPLGAHSSTSDATVGPTRRSARCSLPHDGLRVAPLGPARRPYEREHGTSSSGELPFSCARATCGQPSPSRGGNCRTRRRPGLPRLQGQLASHKRWFRRAPRWDYFGPSKPSIEPSG